MNEWKMSNIHKHEDDKNYWIFQTSLQQQMITNDTKLNICSLVKVFVIDRHEVPTTLHKVWMNAWMDGNGNCSHFPSNSFIHCVYYYNRMCIRSSLINIIAINHIEKHIDIIANVFWTKKKSSTINKREQVTNKKNSIAPLNSRGLMFVKHIISNKTIRASQNFFFTYSEQELCKNIKYVFVFFYFCNSFFGHFI